MSDPAVSDHAIERALERYGLALTAEEIRAVEVRLAAGEGMVLRRDPRMGNHSVGVIRIQGILVTVAYLPGSGRIMSFLPPDAPMKRRWRMR